MKVHELLEVLSKCNPEGSVLIWVADLDKDNNPGYISDLTRMIKAPHESDGDCLMFFVSPLSEY